MFNVKIKTNAVMIHEERGNAEAGPRWCRRRSIAAARSCTPLALRRWWQARVRRGQRHKACAASQGCLPRQHRRARLPTNPATSSTWP